MAVGVEHRAPAGVVAGRGSGHRRLRSRGRLGDKVSPVARLARISAPGDKVQPTPWHTGGMANDGSSRDGAERLSADDRREALLEVTKSLVLERGTAAITMGTVAERAEVTRALVYKHFANREELLASLYRRESKRLDRAMSDVVTAAPAGFEAKLRALVRAALAASEEHGVFFSPLRTFGSQPDARTDRRSWDRRTVRYFAQLAEEDFGVDQRTARAAIAVQLSGLQSLLSQLRRPPWCGPACLPRTRLRRRRDRRPHPPRRPRRLTSGAAPPSASASASAGDERRGPTRRSLRSPRRAVRTGRRTDARCGRLFRRGPVVSRFAWWVGCAGRLGVG